MEVNCFQILLIDVTFYLQDFENVALNVLIKNEKPECMMHRRLKG